MSKKLNDSVIDFSALIGQLGILFTMLFWSPHPDEKYVFFTVSSVQGIVGGLQGPQLNGLYNVFFFFNQSCNVLIYTNNIFIYQKSKTHLFGQDLLVQLFMTPWMQHSPISRCGRLPRIVLHLATAVSSVTTPRSTLSWCFGC